MKKTVLTIAGSDPSGGAGLQRDLKTFAAFKARGLSAVTAVTAQNSSKVKSVLPVPAKLLKEQIELLIDEFTIDAAKTGMIGSAENLRVLARLLKTGKLPNLVVDTVLRSTGGKALIDKEGAKGLKAILPYAAIVTPNLPEAEALTGMKVIDVAGMEKAAKALFEMGAKNVLVKGGHLARQPTDVLFDGKSFTYFKGKRIKGEQAAFHGTGCMLSAAIAAGLANGQSVKTAVKYAKAHLEEELRKRVRA